MAALCTGISYGLSQLQGSATSTDGKELIFVKLTDSAYRAIEEFQRNQGSFVRSIVKFRLTRLLALRDREARS
uniref:RNA polymerase II elongation factor ELL N-terminal domain-containing protein n=1 Tax=Lutzomyia longipalpis TaxID=7200 RepID=A0A1B0CCI5_LUTLO